MSNKKESEAKPSEIREIIEGIQLEANLILGLRNDLDQRLQTKSIDTESYQKKKQKLEEYLNSVKIRWETQKAAISARIEELEKETRADRLQLEEIEGRHSIEMIQADEYESRKKLIESKIETRAQDVQERRSILELIEKLILIIFS